MARGVTEISKGKVLIAEPFMSGGTFRRSVVLLTDYNKDDGAIGFILNKTLSVKVNDLIEDFPEIEAEVFCGGPVAQETLHYIHDVGDILDESISVAGKVCWSGDFNKLKFLIDAKLIQPRNIKFFLGYSGWSPGQLEDEITYGSWVVDDMYSDYAFSTPHKQLWKQVLKNKGEHFSVIAEMPEHQGLN